MSTHTTAIAKPSHLRRYACGVAALALLLSATLAAGTPAWAAKGGVKGGGPKAAATDTTTITLDQTDPVLGSTVTFTVTSATNMRNPRVQVACYQGGSIVWGEAAAVGSSFVLGGGSSEWQRTGGSAYCKADLFDLVWNGGNLQQVTFHASTMFEASG